MIVILKKGLMEMKIDLVNGNYKKQIANILTLSRFFSPFVLLPLFYLNKMTAFVVMIIFFCLTDAFDGYFARRFNSSSTFGRYLDAVVDKIFAITLLIPVLSKNLYIILVLELLITIVNLYAFYKKLNPKTKYIGKIKTVGLFVLIGVLYLKKIVNFSNDYVMVLYIITLFLQLLSLISYILVIKKR